LSGVILALLLLLLVGGLPVSTLAQDGATTASEPTPDLGIVSKRYIVVDAETGEIYAQRGMHERVPLASLTKIFTAIEAIEDAPDAYEITTVEADLVTWEATQVGFGPGETFTLRDLVYGMMVSSGNDAAKAIARSLGGVEGDSADQAVARFMERVNARVRDMGLTDTNLVNPDGWGVPNHYSTAYDIAAFTRYALRYPRFVEAISAEEYVSSGGYRLVNTNKMMDRWDDLLGGKTGYDDTAGYCLMQVARQDGATMIAVTLDGVAPDVWYEDNRVLLDYAFAARAERQAAGVGPMPVVARFLDPDAAVLQRMATSGAGVSGPLPPPALSDGMPAVGGAPDAQPAAVLQVPSPDGAPSSATATATATDLGLQRRDLLLAVAVVLLLAGAAARAAWAATGSARSRGGLT
jgi:D-alanyl-D-alanine carboxypeptidase